MQMEGGRGQTEDGVSLVPLLKGGTTAARDAISWHNPMIGTRVACPAEPSGAWKLIEFYEDIDLNSIT
jgi:hypothetical protein